MMPSGDLERLLDALERNVKVHEFYRRTNYAQMTRFALALFHDHRRDRAGTERDDTTAETIAQKILDVAVAEENTYWEASAHILSLVLAAGVARRLEERERAEQRQHTEGDAEYEARRQARRADKDSAIDKARKAGEAALRVIGTRSDYANLRVDCESRLAEVEVLAGRFGEAEAHLTRAIPSVSSAGFTTNPNVTAMLQLVEADMALRRGRPRQALARLEQFRDTAMPHLETGWLLDYYQRLRVRSRDVHEARTAFIVTDDDVRNLEQNREGYADLKNQLKDYLLKASERLYGPLSDRKLADKLGVDAKTIAEFKRPQKKPGRKRR